MRPRITDLWLWLWSKEFLCSSLDSAINFTTITGAIFSQKGIEAKFKHKDKNENKVHINEVVSQLQTSSLKYCRHYVTFIKKIKQEQINH
jgi:hypothetical protein